MKTKTCLKITVLLFLLTIIVKAQSPCQFNSEFPNPGDVRPCNNWPCGIYYIQNINTDDISDLLDYRDYTEYYDGIFIKLRWNQLEPVQGGGIDPDIMDYINDVFDWAATNPTGVTKQISIGVTAGIYTPDYVMSGIDGWVSNTVNHYRNIKMFGGGDCEELQAVPVPYPGIGDYVGAYNQMMDDLWQYIDGTSTSDGTPFMQLLSMVKMCGINLNNEETKVPVEDGTFMNLNINQNGNCGAAGNYCSTDFVAEWVGKFYTPDLIVNAFMDIQQHTQSLFPDKFLNLVVIPDPLSFPPIDWNGDAIPPVPAGHPLECTGSNICFGGQGTSYVGDCHYYNYHPDFPGGYYCKVVDELIKRCAIDFSPCYAINSTYLSEFPGSAWLKDNYDVLPQLAAIGYQEHHQEAGNYYTPTQMIAMINNGIAGYATFLELHSNVFGWYSDPDNNDPPDTHFPNWMAFFHQYFNSNIECGSFRARKANNDAAISISIIDNIIHFYNKGEKQGCQYTVYDQTGRILKQSNFTALPGDNIIEVKNLNLQPSVYILKIQCAENSFSQKLLVK